MKMDGSKLTVIYHASCCDGFCAAWLVWRKYPQALFIPAQYGQEPPWEQIEGREVMVLDFSWPREVLRRLALLARSLLVLDHHQTAQADLAGLAEEIAAARRLEPEGMTSAWSDPLEIRFDMNKSGARLTHEYLHPADRFDWCRRPMLVNYTEDRDLWRFKLSYSREVNAAIASYARDFAVWEELEFRSVTSLYDEGAAILRYQAEVVASHVRHAGEVELGGQKVLAVNATCLASEIAGELAKGRPLGACWFIRADGKKVWSLRSDENGLDVSEIAKSRGGGGHRHAAGFVEEADLIKHEGHEGTKS